MTAAGASLPQGRIGPGQARRRALSERAEKRLLFLFAASGGIVFIEPSPYELLFIIAAAAIMIGGVPRMAPGILVLAGLLGAFNLGGVFSLAPYLHDQDAVIFIAVSIYLAVTAVFFAVLLGERTQERFDALKWGCIAGAAIASAAGIAGYFDIAGLGALFTLHGRAAGTFKDPNVLGTFVILPLVLLAQQILTGGRFRLRDVFLFALIAFGGLFLSFSRGAWGHAVGSLGLFVLLTFLLGAGPALRRRILVLCVAGTVLLALALAAALSVPEVREMFEVRASLVQDYDVGAQGRFGRQIRAIPELLERPNGYGPLQFANVWPEAPHNVFLNAFAAYGWLGGISYMALIAATLRLGWRSLRRPGPWQHLAIAIWSVLFVQILQSMTIDTDHWRHFYLLLGLAWGLEARAARR